MQTGRLRIGDLELSSPLMLAPISGYCDLAFRQVVRPLGGLGLASTDLVNPRGLLDRTPKSLEIVRTESGDQPLCVQLYGREPDKMADAARWCQDHGAAVIDINMGCPAGKVIRRKAGAALLREPEVAISLADAVVRAVEVPVTAKIRLGWDDDHLIAPELARALEEVGVAAIIVHGRTAEQRFRNPVRLEGIAEVVQAVRGIPVIGNGNVERPADAKAMIERTGCAGVMIGRAALRDPWIFRETHALLTTGQATEPADRTERLRLMGDHFAHLIRLRGERVACIIFRQRACRYLGPMAPCPVFKERIREIQTVAEGWELLRTFPCDGTSVEH